MSTVDGAVAAMRAHLESEEAVMCGLHFLWSLAEADSNRVCISAEPSVVTFAAVGLDWVWIRLLRGSGDVRVLAMCLSASFSTAN